MATASNGTLKHQNHCTICLEGLAVRTTVTLRCRHTFHLDGGPIRHPYLFQRQRRETARMMMGSVNGSGQTSALSHVTRITHLRLGVNRRPNYGYSFQGHVGSSENYDPCPQGMNSIQPVGLEAPDVAFLGEPFSITAPMRQSMNFPSPPVRSMMRAANNRSSSSGLLPVEQTAFQAEGSGTVNIQLPDVGEVVLALSADVPPGDGIDGSKDVMSDGEESVEDLTE
ncbi:hypothetical protein NL676_020750 [Syzygium grande]|nr:hypothetical protein NL676_020750 [Syzygium grande]